MTVEIPSGATDTGIGRQLFEEGLIRSEVAFQYAVITAGREGTLAFGTYDFHPPCARPRSSPRCRACPSAHHHSYPDRGPAPRAVVAAFATSEMTTNLEELAAILDAPPPSALNQFDFLADLPAGRSLEGYIRRRPSSTS